MSFNDSKTIITLGILIIGIVLYIIISHFTKNEDTANRNGNYLISPFYAENATGNKLIEAEYVSTNDGDTFRLRLKGEEERVRLLMIDTPEMNYEENDPMPYADEAKVFTMNLLQNAKKIEVLFDVGPETDKYGRILTYVFVDGMLLQESLLREGYAAVRYIHEPNNTLEEKFRQVEKGAKAKKIKIWSHANYLQNDGFHPEEVVTK